MRPLFAAGLCGVSTLLIITGARSNAPQAVSLVGTIGNDTVAVDRFVRDATVLDGVVFVRRPTPHTLHYKATIAPPAGRFTQLEIVWRDARGTETRSAKMSFGVDSIRSELKAGGVVRSAGALPALDAIPLPPSPDAVHTYALLEHAALVLVNSNKAMPNLEWLAIGARRTEKRRVRVVLANLVEMDFAAGPLRVYLGPDKRVKSLSIGSGANQTIVRRSESDIDIAKLTASFASRDTLRSAPPPP
jgi:hypothetical protein